MDYYVDIVFCLDATGGVLGGSYHYLWGLRDNFSSFYSCLMDSADMVEKEIAKVRVKCIVFKDYDENWSDIPMVESPFFELPEQNEELVAFISAIEIGGGGDTPENSLEALSLALKSDWTTGGTFRRHIVVMMTDAPGHKLGERATCPKYPRDIPETLDELTNWWHGTSDSYSGTFQPKAGRLIAFVPCEYPWEDLQVWDRYWPEFMKRPIEDICRVDIDIIADMIIRCV